MIDASHVIRIARPSRDLAAAERCYGQSMSVWDVTSAHVARLAAPLTVAVLVAGIAGQVTHTGLFFVPALVVMAVATLRLWRESA
jgi:hypothetical protein